VARLRGEIFHREEASVTPLSRCFCIAAAARRRQQQLARAGQPVADNYAFATDKPTDKQTHNAAGAQKTDECNTCLLRFATLPAM